MKKRRFYPEKYYDSRGDLGVPFWFWLLLLWQARSWWEIAFMISGVTSAGLMDDILWWWQLLAGFPVILILFLYPYRRHVMVARWSYILLLVGAMVQLSLTLLKWYQAPGFSKNLWMSQACFDVVLFSVLSSSRHLQDVFWRDNKGSE